MSAPALRKSLGPVEYFTFGFGSMVGVGWLVLIDDWLARGGPGGAMLGFLLGGLALLPVALTYGRLVAAVPDAGAEIAYAEGVLSPFTSFAAAWTMVLAYAIVCPWEAVAVGNLLARVFPALNSAPLYALGGKTIYAPRLLAGLLLTLVIVAVNWRGIRPSGRFQNAATFGLLLLFALFTALGFANGSPSNWQPLFTSAGPWVSALLVMQVVPYFMTGFESVGKGSEEARTAFDPRDFGVAILAAILVGIAFYVTIVAVVSWIFPWQELVAGKIGTEAAFERVFGSRLLSRLIVFAALLSLLKIFNGNFVASTRLLFGIGKRRLVHPALAEVHAENGTPKNAILLMAALTLGATFLGDAVLVPISEVGSLAVGVGWLSACVSFLGRARRSGGPGVVTALLGLIVSAAIVLMKVLPGVPGSFASTEWIAFGAWSLLGLSLYLFRR